MKAPNAFSAFSALSLVTGTLAVTNTSIPANTTKAQAEPAAPLLASGNINLGIAEEAYQKAAAFVATLNNAQKIKIITAQSLTEDPNTTWTALEAKDGVSGVNFQYFVSGSTMSNALINTWDRNHFTSQFAAIGEEFHGTGYNLINGPVIGPLGRVPLGGRAAEGFSPDPYLSGIATGLGVQAMNSAGVIGIARHYLLNEQETNRMGRGAASPAYSSNANDKTAQEVYVWPYADGVKQGMMGVMCAMNRVNDTSSCENDAILNGYLKTDLGFPGLVLPDVGGQTTAVQSANAGLDYGSSRLWSEATMLAAIENGTFTQARLDDMAVRNVIGYYHVGLDNGLQPLVAGVTEFRDVRGNHSALIRQIGAESLILLKNDKTNGGGLPLNKPRTVSLFGAHAGPMMAGPNHAFSVGGEPDVFQGHLVTGGGSGQLSLPYLVTPLHAITNHAIDDGSMIWWIMNNTYTEATSSFPFVTGSNTTFPPGAPGGGGGGGGPGGLGQGTAVTPSFANYAENSDVCLVFINTWAGEGGDRSELTNPAGDLMVLEVAAKCNNTVVVINSSGPYILESFIENENVTAVVYGGLLGQESGNAIADVLYGDVNPSGKLTHTLAKNASQYATGICTTDDCNFNEGVYIDYRWFDLEGLEPRYEFGYGLSYTTFEYGDAAVYVTNATALNSKYATGPMGLGGQEDMFEEVLTINATITNTGAVDGAEVAQLYITFPAASAQPKLVLRGFDKVMVPVGETVPVSFSVRRRDISHWDVVAQKWAVESGMYTFSVAASSRDVRATTTLSL